MSVSSNHKHNACNGILKGLGGGGGGVGRRIQCLASDANQKSGKKSEKESTNTRTQTGHEIENDKKNGGEN